MLLSERIHQALAADIASGALAPGAQLDEQPLADQFQASRTPVREALRQLAVEGLVEVRPRRGVTVASLSVERIGNMFEVAAEIEAMCVRLATHRMNPLERNRLRNLHMASRDAVEAGDFERYVTYNLDFHAQIYAGAHNAFMAEQAMALRRRMAGFRRAQMLQPERPIHSWAEHDHILEAVMGVDGEEAAKRMRSHILTAAGALEGLYGQGDETPA